jgi:hypothetical protein
MVDPIEADHFRRIQPRAEVDRANDMISIEETDAEAERLTAHLKRVRAELIADKTAQIARTRDPFMREFYCQELEEIRSIGNGRYD